MIASLCLNAQEMNLKEVIVTMSLAQRGNPEYQFNLGEMYYNGISVAKDETKAVKWFRKAADQGNASAQYNLGMMYEDGKGVAKDETIAVEWYTKSAEQGNTSAQYNLGVMYEEGKGVKKDETKAAEWFRKVSEQGYVKDEPEPDPKVIETINVEWYKKAAEQGIVDVQVNLGWMYQYGVGVKKDETKALELYRKAAEQGNVKAQFNTGWMYYTGSGIAKDKDKAVEWFKKAAKQNNDRASAYIHAINGNFDNAIATINKAIRLDPNSPYKYDTKGEILYLKGDKDGAKAMWDKIISIAPKFGEKKTPLYNYLFPSN